MTGLETFLFAYIAGGIASVWAEHRTYEFDFEGCSKAYIALNIFHQIVHYIRVGITYPLYIIEDFLLYIMNTYYETEEEEELDLTVCPRCGGEADQGYTRTIPPEPYNCSKCFSPHGIEDDTPY